MGVGLPQSLYRRRLQTGVCCWFGKLIGGERYIKKAAQELSGADTGDDRKGTIEEASKCAKDDVKTEVSSATSR